MTIHPSFALHMYVLPATFEKPGRTLNGAWTSTIATTTLLAYQYTVTLTALLFLCRGTHCHYYGRIDPLSRFYPSLTKLTHEGMLHCCADDLP